MLIMIVQIKYNKNSTLPASQVDTVLEASCSGKPVVHPIIDRIRACSAIPNDAVDFFTHLLHPVPHCRLTAPDALRHPYLSACAHHMRTFSNQSAPVIPDSADTAQVQQQLPPVLRAAYLVASTEPKPVTLPSGAAARSLDSSPGQELSLCKPSDNGDHPLLPVIEPSGTHVWSTKYFDVEASASTVADGTITCWGKCNKVRVRDSFRADVSQASMSFLECSKHELPPALLEMKKAMTAKGWARPTQRNGFPVAAEQSSAQDEAATGPSCVVFELEASQSMAAGSAPSATAGSPAPASTNAKTVRYTAAPP